MLKQMVQDNVGVHIPPQLNDHPHAFPVGLVPQIRDAVHPLVLYQLCNFLNKPGLVDQIRKLRDHDPAFAVGHGLNIRHCPDLDLGTAGTVGFLDSPFSDDGGAGWEVGSFDNLQNFLHGGVPVPFHPVVDQLHHRVNHFPQVVGRNIGSHAYGNACGTVDQQIGITGRKHGRLLLGLVKVGYKIHGVLI